MYHSPESLALPRKHTATEHALTNGDPLIARKKARSATTSNVAPVTTVAVVLESAPPPAVSFIQVIMKPFHTLSD